ncbi:MAG: nitrate- and nitrite sensing domain-containing protein, partial [Actinomycetota bacterium]
MEANKVHDASGPGVIRGLPLRVKILAMALVPMLGLVGFAAVSALDSRAAVAADADAALVMEFAVAGGNLLHETQKERGSTAVYLSSGGTRFVEELPAQHAATDVRRAEFEQFLADNSDTLPAEVFDVADAVQVDLAQLDQQRAAVL